MRTSNTAPGPRACVVIVGLLSLLSALVLGAGAAPSAAQHAAVTPTSLSDQPTGLVRQTGALVKVGGTAITYEVVSPDVPVSAEVIATMVAVLDRRLEGYGIRGSHIVVRPDNRIVVAIPPVDNPDLVAEQLPAQRMLELIDPLGQYLAGGTLVTTSLGGPESLDPPSQDGTPPSTEVYPTILTGADIRSASAQAGPTGYDIVVAFELTERAGETMFEFTSNNLGKPMSIVLDKRVISTPSIEGAISRQGIISGMDPREAEFLAVALNAGPLPARLQPIGTTTLHVVIPGGATLSETPSDRGVKRTPLPAGTLLLATGQSEADTDGNAWVPVQSLAGDQSGYVKQDSLVSDDR